MRLDKTVRSNLFFLCITVVGLALTVFIVYGVLTLVEHETSRYDESVTRLTTELIRAQESNETVRHNLLVLNTLTPVRSGVIRDGYISSRYGYRRAFGRFHRGIDIAAPKGTAIHAYEDGRVSFAGRRGSYGLMIEIEHKSGVKTRYAHCSAIYYSRGSVIKRGEHIADVGNTGRSTGSHLHFELLVNGKQIDPSDVFKNF